MKRRELREHIFELLFRIEFNSPEEMPEQLRLFFAGLEELAKQDQSYMEEKFSRIVDKLPELDKEIEETAKGWKLSRMSRVDLTILRLAVYELKFDEDVPLGVAINEAVELAKKFRVNLEVLSSLERKPGTKVKEVAKVEKTNIAGVAKDTSIARIALIGLEHNPGVAFQVFDLLSKHNINVDVILQSIGREDTKDITFTLHRKDLEEAEEVLNEHRAALRFDHIETDAGIGKVSIVGVGLISNCGVAAKMFEALYEAGINIQMINTSEIRVSVLLDEEDVNRAVKAVHAKFFDEV